ncbi:MAG: hypothetical protein KAH32_08115 [Chlamydiia bacterium]|nr:hypothetical protein [Chlamydiia bacterium]
MEYNEGLDFSINKNNKTHSINNINSGGEFAESLFNKYIPYLATTKIGFANNDIKFIRQDVASKTKNGEPVDEEKISRSMLKAHNQIKTWAFFSRNPAAAIESDLKIRELELGLASGKKASELIMAENLKKDKDTEEDPTTDEQQQFLSEIIAGGEGIADDASVNSTLLKHSIPGALAFDEYVKNTAEKYMYNAIENNKPLSRVIEKMSSTQLEGLMKDLDDSISLKSSTPDIIRRIQYKLGVETLMKEASQSSSIPGLKGNANRISIRKRLEMVNFNRFSFDPYERKVKNMVEELKKQEHMFKQSLRKRSG